MLDFHHMIPKLSVHLRQAVLSTTHSDGCARASGYNHTYTDIHGMDLQALCTYPSDVDIDEASRRGFAEAESLYAAMGVSSDALYGLDSSNIQLPSIKAWFKDTDLFDADGDDDTSDNNSESDVEIENYQAALDSLEDDSGSLRHFREEQLQDYRYATIALSIHDHMKM